jgi:hypothetical protein
MLDTLVEVTGVRHVSPHGLALLAFAPGDRV